MQSPSTSARKYLVAFLLLLVSSFYNFFLVLGGAFNQGWALSRVAGGQYESMPSGLRYVYFFFSLWMVLQIWFATKLFNQRGPWSHRSARILTILLYVSVVSTFLQLISRSSAERWNAIPAFAVVVGYYIFRRHNQTR